MARSEVISIHTIQEKQEIHPLVETLQSIREKTALELYPIADPKKTDDCMRVLQDVFQTFGVWINDQPPIVEETPDNGTILRFKDSMAGGTSILGRETFGFLRTYYNCFFDMPSAYYLREMEREDNYQHNTKRRVFIQASRTNIFDRLVCRTYGYQNPHDPFIVARWNWDSDTPFFAQFGIAVAHQGKPRYILRAIISERNVLKEPELPAEENITSNSQEEEYWKLIFHACRATYRQGYYPYACLVEPMGKKGPIIIAKNNGRRLGDGLENHAEHIGLVEMNDMGYKVDWELRKQYKPRVFTPWVPCQACALMMREQRVAEVNVIRKQKGWNGIKELEDEELTPVCGPPPKINEVEDVQLQKEVLAIVKEANEGRFKREFWRNAEGIF